MEEGMSFNIDMMIKMASSSLKKFLISCGSKFSISISDINSYLEKINQPFEVSFDKKTNELSIKLKGE